MVSFILFELKIEIICVTFNLKAVKPHDTKEECFTEGHIYFMPVLFLSWEAESINFQICQEMLKLFK